jgi:glyoxylase I family protein
MLLARTAAICCAGALVAAGVSGRSTEPPEKGKEDAKVTKQADAFRATAVRYQIKDVERATEFYTQRLGFKLEMKGGAAFAKVTSGGMTLWLSGPESSGSRPMPDGRKQAPGGWNRIALEVQDLDAAVEKLKKARVHFRNEIESGPGGRQIQIEDPDGNPVELFEPTR